MVPERVSEGRHFHRAEQWSVKFERHLHGSKKSNLQAGFQQLHSNSRNNDYHPAKVTVRAATLTRFLEAGLPPQTRRGSERF